MFQQRTVTNNINWNHPPIKYIKKLLIRKKEQLEITDFLDYLRKRKEPRYFFDVKEKKLLVNKIKNSYRKDYNNIIQRADLLREKVILFKNRWDMERTTKPQIMKERLDWRFTPNNDSEWYWMFNRHRFLVDLGKAYWLTEDEDYARELVFYIRDWISKNDVLLGIDPYAWRPLDIGIRLINWIKIMHFMKNSEVFTDDDFISFLGSIIEQAQLLFNYYIQLETNHWILATCGLGVVSIMFPEFIWSSIWLNAAIMRLEKYLKNQVYHDGMYYQSAPMYHNEVILYLLEFYLLAKLNGIKDISRIGRYIEKMGEASAYLNFPDGSIPLIGDSDNFDGRDLITMVTLDTMRGDLKSRAYSHLDEETLWYFGTHGIKRYESIQSKPLKKISYSFDDSGYYVMRGDRSEDSFYLVFYGKHSKGATHAHSDFLSYICGAYGKIFLNDSGRYSYGLSSKKDPHKRINLKWRRYFKVSSAHNTVVVDRLSQREFLDGSQWKDRVDSKFKDWCSNTHFDFVIGQHNGYRRLVQRDKKGNKIPAPVLHARKIFFKKQEYWIIMDILRTKTQHTYDLYYHFEPMKVNINKKSCMVYTKEKDSKNLAIIPVDSKQCKLTKMMGWISHEYNQKKQSPIIKYRKNCKGPTSFNHIILPFRGKCIPLCRVTGVPVYQKGHVLSSEKAFAMELKLRSCIDLFYISHTQARKRQFNGYTFLGQIVLISKNIELDTYNRILIKKGKQLFSIKENFFMHFNKTIEYINLVFQNNTMFVESSERTFSITLLIKNFKVNHIIINNKKYRPTIKNGYVFVST